MRKEYKTIITTCDLCTKPFDSNNGLTLKDLDICPICLPTIVKLLISDDKIAVEDILKLKNNYVFTSRKDDMILL